MATFPLMWYDLPNNSVLGIASSGVATVVDPENPVYNVWGYFNTDYIYCSRVPLWVNQGATISSCTVGLLGIALDNIPNCSGTIQCAAMDTAGNLTGTPTLIATYVDYAAINAIPLTAASVTWNITETWLQNVSYASPNLATCVQEVVSRAGWVAGNMIMFVFKGTAGARRKFGFSNNGLVETASPNPTITSISPNNGTAAGGTMVTITGTNFAAGATVSLGGIYAANIVVVNGTTITCTTPAHSPGVVSVVVTNTSGLQGISQGYTYNPSALPVPTFTSVIDNYTDANVPKNVTITGTGFQTGAQVYVCGTLATNIIVSSSTSISFTVPAKPAGVCSITITNPDGQSVTQNNAFTYNAITYPAPTITSISPTHGSVSGGTFVRIYGTNYQAAPSVLFGTSAATDEAVSSGTLAYCRTPAHSAGLVDVTITNVDAQTAALPNAYLYEATAGAAPIITTVTPTSAILSVDTAFTLVGSDFVSGAGFDIDFGVTSANTVLWVSATQATCHFTPASLATNIDVTLTNPDGQYDTYEHVSFILPTSTLSLAGATIAPPSGPTTGGSTVRITGAVGIVNGANVSIGGTAATNIVVVSATELRFDTPAHAAGLVSVTVTNPYPDSGTSTKANCFTFIAPLILPSITEVNPDEVQAGIRTIGEIVGTNFVTGAEVWICGIEATVISVTPTRIQFYFPRTITAGNVCDVTVINPSGDEVTLPDAVTFTDEILCPLKDQTIFTGLRNTHVKGQTSFHLPTFADRDEALAGCLQPYDLYKTADGTVKIV